MPQNIVLLTGAGISQESGLKTFRDDNGLWEGHAVEEVATPEAFARQPELVHRFYNLRREQLKSVFPNKAHEALADWEKNHPGSFTLITQNVDDLHERAGSQNIIAIHGRLDQARCLDSGEIFEWTKDLDESTPHPKDPQVKGRLRPHICWFGEMPFHMGVIEEALQSADLFVAIGTSGVVYPAAQFVNLVPPNCHRVLLNKEEAQNNPDFNEVILGPATEVVPQFIDQWKSNQY